jgi:hypothetical protein
MEKFRCTGICRITNSDWKILINHVPIRVKLYKQERYIGINHFEPSDREQIKQIINDRILKFQEDEK